MKICFDFKEILNFDKPIAVAIGNFDGVHIGHQQLIRTCVEESHEKGWLSCAMTFHPHPKSFFDKEGDFKLINTPEQKYNLIALLGIDILIVIPFDKYFSETSPEDFIAKYLVKFMHIKKIYIGFNFFFGKMGRGTPELLADHGKKYEYETKIIPPIYKNDSLVSSSLVREQYRIGNIKAAFEFLGYWPFFEGIVEKGEGRGRNIGFRTANIHIPNDLLLPRYGVYAAWAEIPGDQKNEDTYFYPAIVNIGIRPTFHIEKPIIEIHLLDYSEDIYKKNLRINLLGFIRDELYFTDMNEMRRQIESDIKEARNLLKQKTFNINYLHYKLI